MNGVLLINKEQNFTSRDIVNIVSKKLNLKKVGHAGTLDPLATGLLVICIGRATKIVEILTNDNKTYIAEITLGITTDTLDKDGKVIKEENSYKTNLEIQTVLKSMKKQYYQQVPIYSAVKIKGKRLYKYARKNIEIELPKRLVNIIDLELLDLKYQDGKTIFKIKCEVSKGTYIRSLVQDIAFKLNTIGYMSSLVRIKQGDFLIENSISIKQFLNNEFNLISIKDSLKIETIQVSEELKTKIKNGRILDNIYNSSKIMFVDKEKALAIYKTYLKDNTKLKPWKMF